MPESPSAPLLKMLQQAIQQRKQNTSSLAQLTKIPRKQLKKILSGQEPLTVDALILLGEALKLDAEFLHNMGMSPITPLTSAPPKQQIQLTSSTPEDAWEPDPYGNHHVQLIRMGFALGINFWLVFDTSKLENSGVPKYVIEKHAPHLRIQLESQFHPYIEPKYQQHGIELRLSFDALYTCLFPWNSIIQIIFTPAIIDDEPPPKPKEPTKRPVLRVVK